MVVGAPSSGSGKTTVTLGLLRALARRGRRVAPFKVGPDYLDPAFHAVACGRPSPNLDGWAMRPATLTGLVARYAGEAEIVVAEGVMGLFDGPAGAAGAGSTAAVATHLDVPVLLVLDVSGQAASAAAVAEGFARFRPGVRVAGVVLNRVASARHESLVRAGFTDAQPPVVGAIARADELTLPSRHLGLVQASEHAQLDAYLDRLAEICERSLDLDRIEDLAAPLRAEIPPKGGDAPIPAPGRRIAVARDEAFAFFYPHVADGWRSAGAELRFFSPLADEPPDPRADAVVLPGGYPELHAGRLAAAGTFLAGLREAARRGATVYGECGGYMVLGESLVDGDGVAHAMAGLLPVRTSFARRRRTLGYRAVTTIAPGWLGGAGAAFGAHEFHYATITEASEDGALFDACAAGAETRAPVGHRVGTVSGSFVHLIDRR